MAMKEKLATRVPRSGLPLSEMSNVTGSTCIAGATASAALEKFSKKLSVTPSQLTNMTNGTTLPNTSACRIFVASPGRRANEQTSMCERRRQWTWTW